MSALCEVPLPAGSRVIADLHIDLEHAQAAAGFLAWLERAASAPRLVILGDLFEYWIGRAQADTPGGRQVLAALAQHSARGTAIEVVPGNRDFLLDRRFEEVSGCRLHPRGLVGALPDGRRALLLHGDELASLDRAYQRLRRVLRAPGVRWTAEHAPYALTRALARRLRQRSRRAVAAKPAERKALQAAACAEHARRHAVQLVVCGHAHRFRDETLAGGERWIVLDAFGGERDELVVVAAGEVALGGSGRSAAAGRG
jgi:UDP-2,3-diacylglucosamine hydrolase